MNRQVLLVLPLLGSLGCAQILSQLPGGTHSGETATTTTATGGGSGEELRSGLVTTELLDATPPGFRVSWINWDSGFRGSGLEIGDRIIAIDGHAIVKPATLEETQRVLPKSIGQYAEPQGWAGSDKRDGAPVTLTVLRRSPSGVGTVTTDVKGVLHGEQNYRNAEDRPAIGPNGPAELANDGFGDAWSSWYEKTVRFYTQALDGSWQQRSFNTRTAVADHLADKPRVDYLVQHYPGPFANAERADWEHVRTVLDGRAYSLTDRDLAYRKLDDERAAQIAQAAGAAGAAFVRAHAADIVPAFPAIDPIRGDRKKVAGKLVALATIPLRDWVSEADHCYLYSGAPARGFYFVDCNSPGAGRMFAAYYRYQKFVSPQIQQTYAIVGRIQPTPKMLVINGRAATGLAIEPVAATIGDKAFVDLTIVKGKDSPFAGEETLVKLGDRLPPATATPRQVLEASIAALKGGQEQTWRSLFATWRAERWEQHDVIYYPYAAPSLDLAWVDSRRLLLDKVYDARVVYVSDVRTLLSGKEFRGAPHIDEVLVELDHVGKFDGAYRAFNDVTVHRQWILQRINGGPWRIASAQGL